MEHCIRGAERVCGSRDYHAVGAGRSSEEYGGKGGYQIKLSERELVVRCGMTPAEGPTERELVRAHGGKRPAPCKARPKTKAKRKKTEPPETLDTVSAALLCTPGATQRCVGPGGCDGGQSCKPDGSGYEACDCGPSASVPAADAPGTSAPANAAGTP